MLAAARSMPTKLDAFLVWENNQPERYELVGGVVRRLDGVAEGENRIAGNIIAFLRPLLRGTACSVHSSNLKVICHHAQASMYPDVFVRCGERDGSRTPIDDAVLVVEVISPSTAHFDLTRKRYAYESIPSLRRIVFVSTSEARLDIRVRGEDGIWRDEVVEGLEASLSLPDLGLTVPMSEIYAESEVAAPID